MNMERKYNSDTLVPNEFPASHAEVFSTEKRTLYLKEPGVVMVAATAVNIQNIRKFLEGFPAEYEFPAYLKDSTKISSSDQLIKLAGQVCYASFGPKRTWNIDVNKYILNLIQSGHGSVLQHVNFSFLFYGISRSFSHEMIRHGAGTAFSQLSQRYVSGRVLRFVERPEYQNDEFLHKRFENRIDKASQEYEEISEYLLQQQQQGTNQILSAEHKTDLRKKVQQAARSILPNETETSKIMTANIRSWRHIINMRANEHAETEIRAGTFKIFEILRQVAPNSFSDFEVIHLSDGTKAVKTQYPKV